MEIDSFSHPFYDIEIELAETAGETVLVKILSIDGRRFTYQLRGALTEEAVQYMKTLMDSAVFTDMVVEHSAEGWEVRQSPVRLKKHS
jgi:hypothetical protein